MDVDVAKNYKSKSQIARVLTENWLLKNGFCPSCENNLTEVSNNARVHDFSCLACKMNLSLKASMEKHRLRLTMVHMNQ